MKLLIVTTDKKVPTWKTLDAKLTAIANALNQTKNATWEVTIEYQDITPEVTNGRITHKWFNSFSYPYFRRGYEHVYLHFLKKRWKELKLDTSIRGSNQIDTDYVGEAYGWADESTKRGISNHNQFIQNVLHEIAGHELARACGIKDITHEVHKDHVDLTKVPSFFQRIDMNSWQPRYQEQTGIIAWLKEQISKLLKENKMIHPLRLPFRDKVSQKYGVPNSIYKKTGVHLGTDYPCPVGTPLTAPQDGEVVFIGTSKERGNYIQYKHGDYLLEMRHLSKMMPLGKYRLGDVIALSGNTGSLTTGPHVCMVVWLKEDGLSKINKENWKVLTTDADKLYI